MNPSHGGSRRAMSLRHEHKARFRNQEASKAHPRQGRAKGWGGTRGSERQGPSPARMGKKVGSGDIPAISQCKKAQCHIHS
jgi:hypothetical protein